MRKMISRQLTACSIVKSGAAIRLEFLDGEGQPAFVEFPFDQAESIVMTLPRVLANALQRSTRDPSSRYVFSLGRWSIERNDDKSLIVTLGTDDGFHASFAIPFDACRSIGWALNHEGRPAVERDDVGRPVKEPRSLN